MRYHPFHLLLLPIILITISGCISQKLPQEQGLVGDLFREECNENLPCDIQNMVVHRRERYEDVNDIHNINFVILRDDECMPNDEYKKLYELRWKLLRAHRLNEIALEEAKVLCTKYKKSKKRKAGQDLCAQYDKIRRMHVDYMQQTSYLLCKTEPYKFCVIDKFIETWGYY